MQVVWLAVVFFLLMILFETSISFWLNFGSVKNITEEKKVRSKEKHGLFKGKLQKKDVS
ncbi:hypothetical protein I6J18_21110 [Peribacillus psychrosaccharolyticus]|uniref:Uncharacterized protein n=1 Tax=Peribacillus psychrosaccharolyticus TaxID=1407 RepID=A0A974NLD7_PERPY|nr:hypothetical protein [Peribacillus psychrosaccharolyticus]MEC2056830.1 hypothetical protein [Peribacillus psychrosaccharolyticus]MED3746284.1 hypothetical protein [Peribacillus psychrosaccharolyticus]QQT00047.1 hypothetical protein I6J18_21110 [Peribacillus psychrosaccharolyticus]